MMRTFVPFLGLMTACNGKSFECEDASFNDDNPTAPILRFDTPKDGTSTVTFSYDGGPETTTPSSDPAGSHEHVLLGIPPETEVTYTASVDYDGDIVTCEGTVTTRAISPRYPDYEITVDDPSGYDEPYLFVAMLQAGVLAVIDRAGNPLWTMWGTESLDFLYQNYPASEIIEDEVVVVHAAMWPEQHQLVYNIQSQDGKYDIGSLRFSNWLKEDLRSEALPRSHHMFALHEDTGTVGFMTLEYQDWFDKDEGEKISVIGDSFHELDSDGTITEVFNVWDHFEVEKNDRWDIPFYADGKDWTHGNAMNYFPESESYLLSFANLNSFVEVHRDGTLLETFDRDSWSFGDDTPFFSFQHDPRFGPDNTISMISLTGTPSAIVYEMDEQSRTLTKVWQHKNEDLPSVALGENRLLPNGNRLVNFGGGGMLREVNPEGEVVWELTASASDVWFGSVELFSDFYTME